MKSKLWLFFFLFNCVSNAQDWQLFPFGQVNYYSTDNEIMEFCFDSVVVNGDKHTYYSRSLRNYSIYENCDSSIINSEYISFLFPKPRINIYSMSNDTIIYEFDRFGKVDATRAIFIPLNLSINDTFKCNQNITIICYAKVYKDILKGIKDSVKYFEFSQNGKIISEIELSKNYGLIQFFDFHKLLVSPGSYNTHGNKSNIKLKLIGIKNQDISFGVSVHNFEADDIFDLQIGDEKYWRKFDNEGSSYTKDKLVEFKDSVKGIKMKFAIYDRKIFNNFGQIISNESYFEYYYKESLKKILGNRENIFFTDYQYLGTDLYKSEVLYLLHDGGDYLNISDSTLTFGYNPIRVYYNGVIVNNNCILDMQTDTYGEKIYSPYIGLSYFFYDNMYPEGCTYKLIGFKMKGEIFGNVPDFLTSTKELSKNKVCIYPNPTFDKLTLSQIPEGAVSYEIFDIFGCKVLSTPSLRETPQEGNWEIDVSELTSGIYFLKLNNQPPLKFVKL